MAEKVKKSDWQKDMEEWREDVDRQLAQLFAAVNEIDAAQADFDTRLIHTNKKVIKLMVAQNEK